MVHCDTFILSSKSLTPTPHSPCFLLTVFSALSLFFLYTLSHSQFQCKFLKSASSVNYTWVDRNLYQLVFPKTTYYQKHINYFTFLFSDAPPTPEIGSLPSCHLQLLWKGILVPVLFLLRDTLAKASLTEEII